LFCSTLSFKNLTILSLIIFGLFGTAFGHTIDYVDEYRLDG